MTRSSPTAEVTINNYCFYEILTIFVNTNICYLYISDIDITYTYLNTYLYIHIYTCYIVG